LLGSGGATSAQAASRVRILRQDKVLVVEIDHRQFTTYHFADDFVRPYVRPFFWPVLAADGTAVTNDQAQDPKLPPYQRSMWVGHGDVNGADHWKFSGQPVPPRQRHVKFDFIKRDAFQEELIWEDATGGAMLNEIRTVRFIAYADGSRAVDITLRLSPVSGDVDFANHKDHGLFSIRPLPSIAGDPQFSSSRGTNECSQPSAWCDESGNVDGKTYGMVIFDDPRNPRHPPMWHAHKDARLATDIFVTPDATSSTGDFVIKSGSTATFRYRAVIHGGDAAAAQIAAKYAEFAAGK
jgi:Methane oxygenase PmoA